MKKTIVSAIIIGIFVLYCFLHAQAAPVAFYLSGPPDMVRATERMLKNMQVNPKQMKKDFFPGLV